MPSIHMMQMAAAGAGSLDADYITYAAAMTTPPSAAWKTAINQLFVDLKAALNVAALSSAWDAAWFLAAETEQAALLNMVKRSHDATNSGTTFTASRGFAGDGATTYINTNYNPATQAVNVAQNSTSLGVYTRTEGLTNRVDFGSINAATTQRLFIAARLTGTSAQYPIHQGTTSSGTVANNLGLTAGNRSGASAAQLYKNGSSVATNTVASTGVTSRNLYICARNNADTPDSFSTNQIAFAFIGRSMTGTEHGNVYTAIQAAMTAIGANV